MEDKKLIILAKTDENAVEQLCKKYKSLVSSIARRYFIVGGDIDDITQEGMIGLYKAISSYEENKHASFKTFAALCIKRQIFTAIKKANSKKNQVFLALFDNDAMAMFDQPSNRENPEKNFISKENIEYLNQVINNKLSRMEKLVLKEYLDGKSYTDVALLLNLPKKSVDNALNRIRQKLSHLLGDIEQ